MSPTTQAFHRAVTLPEQVFEQRDSYIQLTREGIPGSVLKQSMDYLGGKRELFARIMDVDSSNLSRLYRRRNLGRSASEDLLDSVRVIYRALTVFDSREQAIAWLEAPLPALGRTSPFELFDTFEGRRMVTQALRKIETGDFG